MNTVEFKTKIKNGIIEIPESYKTDLTNQENVQVIIITQPPIAKQIPSGSPRQSSNLLHYLLEHPLKIDSFIPLKREDIYER